MGIKRIVDVTFWTDGKVDDFTPEDKYFMLYLLTNPFTTQLGIYELSIKQAAFQMGYSKEAVIALIERFANKYNVIVYSEETGEIAVKNYLRHSIIKGGAPVRDCLIKELRKVKDKTLIAKVFAHIKGSEELNETVARIIREYEEQNGELYYTNNKDIKNDNDNDNDNEVSYHESYNDTGNESYNESLKNAKPVKHKYGEYKNVLLSDSDYEKLKTEFPADYEERIEKLSAYIESTGKKYKNHLATIRNWYRMDKERKEAESNGNNRGNTEEAEKLFQNCGSFI